MLEPQPSRSNLDQNWLRGMGIVSEGILARITNEKGHAWKNGHCVFIPPLWRSLFRHFGMVIPPLWNGDFAALEWCFRRLHGKQSCPNSEKYIKYRKKLKKKGKKKKRTCNFRKSLTMSANTSELQKIALPNRACENLYPKRKHVAKTVLHKSSNPLQN